MASYDIVSDFGAKNDTQTTTVNCTINAGSLNVLHTASSVFVSGDVGKSITIVDPAGTYGNLFLATTITAFTSGTQVTLGSNGTAISNKSMFLQWGSDNTGSSWPSSVGPFEAFNNTLQSQTGPTTLTIPSGGYWIGGASSAGRTLTPFAGAKNGLTVQGATSGPASALYDNGYQAGSPTFFLGGGKIQNNSSNSAKIATAHAGDTSVFLRTFADNSKFSVGDWIIACGLAQQVVGDPNWQCRSFHKITNIDTSGGGGTIARIDLDSPLKYDLLQTWPEYNAGFASFGGPAGIFKMGTQYGFPDFTFTPWGGTIEIHNLTISQILGTDARDLSIKFYNCTMLGKNGPFPSGSDTWEVHACDFSDCLVEIDKCVNSLVWDSTPARHMLVQSPSGVLSFTQVGSTITEQDGSFLTNSITSSTFNDGGGNKAIDLGGQYGSILQVAQSLNGVSAVALGENSGDGLVEGCGNDAGGDGNPGVQNSYSIASTGIITIPKSTANNNPVSWAVPGAYCMWRGKYKCERIFQVVSVYDDATNIYVQTTWTGASAFPSVPLGGDGLLRILQHPATNLTVSGSSGCADLVDLSGGLANSPIYSYSKRRYQQADLQTHVSGALPLWGKFKKLTVNINTPYSGGALTLDLRKSPIILTNNTESTYEPVVDLTVGPRTIVVDAVTQTVTGSSGADSSLTPSDWSMWFPGQANNGPNPSTFPISSVDVEIIWQTDQGISLGSSTAGSSVPHHKPIKHHIWSPGPWQYG